MALNHAGRLDHGGQTAVRGPEVPFFQEGVGLAGGLGVKLLEG